MSLKSKQTQSFKENETIITPSEAPLEGKVKVDKPPVLKKWARLTVFIVIPLLLSFLLYLPLISVPEGKVFDTYAAELRWIYITLVVALYLIGVIIPFAVTSLIPFLFYPFYGIAASSLVAATFMSNVNMSHFCTLIIVLAVHVSGLRYRLSLTILTVAKGSIKRIYIATFIASMVITMILNSAFATFLMIKVVDDLLEFMKKEVSNGSMGDDRMNGIPTPNLTAQEPSFSRKTLTKGGDAEASTGPSIPPPFEASKEENVDETNPNAEDKKVTILMPAAAMAGGGNDELDGGTPQEEMMTPLERFEFENDQLLQQYGAELLYAVAVAANVASYFLPTSSPVGTDLFYVKYLMVYKWSLINWLGFSIPLLLINAAIALGYLFYLNFGRAGFAVKMRGIFKFEEKRLSMARQSPRVLEELVKLCKTKHVAWSFQDICTLALIVLYIIVNLFRWPGFMKGWAELVPTNPYLKEKPSPVDIGESVILVLLVLLIFFGPKAGIGIFLPPHSPTDKPRDGAFLPWKNVQNEFPWTVIAVIAGSRCIGIYSDRTIAPPLSNYILGMIVPTDGTPATPSSIATKLKLLMMMFGIFMNFLIPNPGTSLILQNLWTKTVPGSPLLIPVLSVTILTFMLPCSSIPNVIVYSENKLSAFYFLKVGTPLFIITVLPTICYALMWGADGLTSV